MINQYLEWILKYQLGLDDYYISNYSEVLEYLHTREFIALIDLDNNRISDGLRLRECYSNEHGDICINAPGNGCSVLEMMAALAVRCEQSVMGDSAYGDRTGLWFRCMMESMVLDNYDNDHFLVDEVSEIVDTLINRKFLRNGKGSLFHVKGTKNDMRKTEIWFQMHEFLNKYY